MLLQEYLVGEEWIVDTMSRDGEHVVVAIWRYDKGEANGAPFCYYGAEPVGCTDERARGVAAYALAVLDALEWRWGPVHMEVMWVSKPTAGGEERGPVLIEANVSSLLLLACWAPTLTLPPTLSLTLTTDGPPQRSRV